MLQSQIDKWVQSPKVQKMLEISRRKTSGKTSTAILAVVGFLVLAPVSWGIWSELGRPQLLSDETTKPIRDFTWRMYLSWEINEPVDLGPNVEFIASDGVDALVRTIIGEKVYEDERTIVAIAHVVFNRVRHGGFGGNTIRSVLLQSGGERTGSSTKEFQTWHYTDTRINNLSISQKSEIYKRVFAVVKDTILGRYPDNTGGALYYSSKGSVASLNCSDGNARVIIGKYSFCRTG